MKKISLIFFLQIIGYALFSQTQYYVSSAGSNANDGTSIALAWKTIQHACDNATPNSVVNILAGTYPEKLEVNVSGNLGNTITFQNYNADVVTIDGASIAASGAMLGIYDQSYIIIKGLNITNNQEADAQGIVVEGNCQNIELWNNDISNINFSTNAGDPVSSTTNSQGLIVNGTDGNNAISNLILDGNTVHNCRTGFSEGLAINGNVDGFELRNNTVHHITNIGIDLIGHEGTAMTNDQARNGLVKNNTVYNCISPYAPAGGIYVDGARDIIIENNRIYQCQWGIEIGCEHPGKSASNIKARNNLIYDNEDASISLGGFDYPMNSGKVTDCYISNNSCFRNDTNSGGVASVTGELSITYTENCVLENNIFYATNAADIIMIVEAGSMNLSLNYNQFYMQGAVEFEYASNTYTSFGAYQLGAGQDANSIFSDPMFVNPALPDLHLLSSSPGRDIGNPAFVAGAGEEDIDAEARVQNSRVDIGADEFALPLATGYLEELSAIPQLQYIELKWLTEANKDYFLVERSSNGMDWKVLKKLETTTNAQRYTYLDLDPISGSAYYRIKIYDKHGHFEYSNIVLAIWNKAWQKIKIAPNPFRENAIVHFYNPKGLKHHVKIYDRLGRAVSEIKDINTTEFTLPKENLKSGLYFLEIRNERTTVQLRTSFLFID